MCRQSVLILIHKSTQRHDTCDPITFVQSTIRTFRQEKSTQFRNLLNTLQTLFFFAGPNLLVEANNYANVMHVLNFATVRATEFQTEK